jgi:hypothetical protein
VVPFTVPDLDVRGRVVRLGPSIDTILARHNYPEPVSRVLGEAAALTVLLGTALKFEGRFQLQTKSDGPISMMVVDFNAPDNFRAVAHIDEAKLEQAVAAGTLSTGDLLGEGHLAMTVDQGSADDALSGRGGADPAEPRRGGASVFPPVGADPEPHPARRRLDRGPGGAGNGAPAGCSCSSCRIRSTGCAPPTSIPAMRPKAMRS